MSFTVVVGNPRPASRTASVAVAAARAVVRAAGLPDAVDVVDLSALGPAVLESPTPREVTDALDRVRASDLLLVASPVYKGAYTGLLKAFLDRFGGGELAGAVAVPFTVSGAPAHRLAADVHLRPLLVELGASTPTRAFALDEGDLPALSERVERWIDAEAALLRALVGRRAEAAVA